MKILGKRYFSPHVAKSKTHEKEKLPFYLIPVKNALLKIKNKCGNIIIRNQNQIYRPVLIEEMLPTLGEEVNDEENGYFIPSKGESISRAYQEDSRGYPCFQQYRKAFLEERENKSKFTGNKRDWLKLGQKYKLPPKIPSRKK